MPAFAEKLRCESFRKKRQYRAEVGGSRELRYRRNDPAIKPGTTDVLAMQIPSGWLAPGIYRITLHTNGAEVPITAAFTLQVADEELPNRQAR